MIKTTSKALRQFSLASAVYIPLMGLYLASQAVGFQPTAALAALGK